MSLKKAIKLPDGILLYFIKFIKSRNFSTTKRNTFFSTQAEGFAAKKIINSIRVNE